MMRMTRAAIINLLASPYIEMARLKGLRPRRVIVRHALPNALAPIINVVALNLAYLIIGVVVVEVVFVYPGLGQLMVDSVAKRDVPVVQAAALIFAATYVLSTSPPTCSRPSRTRASCTGAEMPAALTFTLWTAAAVAAAAAIGWVTRAARRRWRPARARALRDRAALGDLRAGR